MNNQQNNYQIWESKEINRMKRKIRIVSKNLMIKQRNSVLLSYARSPQIFAQ